MKDFNSNENALVNAQLLTVALHLALRRGTAEQVTLPRFMAETALDAASKLVRYLEAQESGVGGVAE